MYVNTEYCGDMAWVTMNKGMYRDDDDDLSIGLDAPDR